MQYIAGIDIGNATTEAALGLLEAGEITAYWSGIAGTTGIKGTIQNITGIVNALLDAVKKARIEVGDISMIRMNEATPVIGDFAMETITETVITESTLIGHNPNTPGGIGVGIGKTVHISNLNAMDPEKAYIVIVPDEYDFNCAARIINEKMAEGYEITGAIAKNDDGVLINNRLEKKIPIVDEVERIEKVPVGMKCAVEVAPIAGSIDLLSNPYGIATVFGLSAEETKYVIHIAKALIGNRSAVVIKTPAGSVRERRIPAGELIVYGENRTYKIEVDKGAEKIMEAVDNAKEIHDVKGAAGTNVGGMIEKVRQEMAAITQQDRNALLIKDIMAVDTLIPKEIQGNLANEFSMEKAVGLAAMVKTDKLHMERLAEELSAKLGIPVEIGGVEGKMAIKGALTTPGCDKPILMVDVGAGSTDACYMNEQNETKAIHLAGAGDMVSMLINAELGLNDINVAEEIKKYPLGKVESLYHIRHEDGSIEFFKEPLDSAVFARVVVVKPDGCSPILTEKPMEKIKQVRQDAKRKVLINNVLRALKKVSLTGSVNEFQSVVLVGGSSLDFEFANMVTDVLAYYGIISGKGNIRGTEGPRNAVATGLLLSYVGEA